MLLDDHDEITQILIAPLSIKNTEHKIKYGVIEEIIVRAMVNRNANTPQMKQMMLETRKKFPGLEIFDMMM